MAKLRRITLVDQVVDELGRLIREAWEGEEELPSISELGQQFGVSRAVVREALKALEAQGMVEITNGKRAKVVRESTRPLLRYFANAVNLDGAANGEIVELWHTMEGNAVALAATNRSEAELSRLQEIVRRGELEAHNPEAFAVLDMELHEEILRAAHNRVLRDLVHSLREMLVDPTAGEPTRNILSDQMRLNVRVVNAITRGDSHAARRAMEMHLESTPVRRPDNIRSPLPDRAPVSPV